MIKNKLTQIIFRTIYIVLGVIGIIGSLGYFKRNFNENFYLYYTNLSNYICFGVIFYALIKTIKSFKSSPESYCNVLPKFKFMSLIMILVTCLVYNILLAKDYTVADYFLSIQNLILHLILPIMFTLDWALFTEHCQTKWYYPLLATVMPLIYVLLILIRAAILGSNYHGLLYPYFFLNVAKLGLGGLIGLIAILVLIFVTLGYGLFGLDHIKRMNKNKNY